ncbi:MAG: hypothetical protein WC509_03125 [Candidatus Izemoplasmatales bacterium]
MGRYFGTDGIRGEYGVFLTEDVAFRLGRSLRTLGVPVVVVGRDTRASGPVLAASVIRGATSAGIDAIDLGVVSTPALSYLSGRLEAVGVMITASHNPYQDNGLKVFGKGRKLFEREEGALEDDIAGLHEQTPPDRPGKLLPGIDAVGLYGDLLRRVLCPSALRVALDCANGSTWAIAPRFFRMTGCDLRLTGVEPDGKNINLGVGSTHIDHLRSFAHAEGCDVGFAFDGDGDRLIAVDGTGAVYDGDMLVYVIAVDLKTRGLLNHDRVALTKMSNLGLVKALARRGIDVVTTDVGDKHVLEAMEAADYTVGGENSGHIIDRHLLNTGDGVLNALHLLSIMERTKSSLAALTADVRLYPDRLVNVRNVDKALADDPAVKAAAASVAARLGTDGKVLVRASGTEPLIRVSVSAPTPEEVDEGIAAIVAVIETLRNSR